MLVNTHDPGTSSKGRHKRLLEVYHVERNCNEARGVEEMRLPILLAVLVLLSACTETDSNAMRVFERAFATDAPPSNVVPLNGYRLERGGIVGNKEMWRLHLGGPGARSFVQERWPDLEAATVRNFVQGSQTPWFAPTREVKYITLISKTDPAVMVMMSPGSDEVFIAYDGL